MEQSGSCGCQNGRVKLESNVILEGGVWGGGEKGGEGGEDLAVFPGAGEVREPSVRLGLSGLCGEAGSRPRPAALGCCLSLALSRPPARAVAVCGSWDSVSGCSQWGLTVTKQVHQTGLRSTCSIAPSVSSIGMFYQVFKRISSPNYYPYFTDWKTEAQRSCPGSQS